MLTNSSIVPNKGLIDESIEPSRNSANSLPLRHHHAMQAGSVNTHMEVGNRQQLRLARCEPRLRCMPLAFGTVAIAAGVVGNARVRAILAALDMTAKRFGATDLDRGHDAALTTAQMRFIDGTPGSTVAADPTSTVNLPSR